MKYQGLFPMYYHYVNSAVLSRNSQNVNVCVLSMYYHVLLFQISDHRQRTPGNWSKSSRIHSVHPQSPRMTQNSHQLLTHLYYSSEACPNRERSEIPANYANSAQFAHIVRESREIRTNC